MRSKKCKFRLEHEGAYLRVIAEREFYCQNFFIKKGQKGGLIQTPENLSQDGNCWVDKNAIVYGNARVEHDALVTGSAVVCADALVRGRAVIKGDAQIVGRSCVEDDAIVDGFIEVFGVHLKGAAALSYTNGVLTVNNISADKSMKVGIESVLKRKPKDKEPKEYCRVWSM